MELLATRRDACGAWQISAGVKNPKHVLMFFQRTNKQNALTQNLLIFDTLDTFDGNDWAKLSTCHLQYGASDYPKLEYESDDETRLRHNLINYSYRKNDYNTGTKLNATNYSKLYSVIYFYLRGFEEVSFVSPVE